MSKASFYDKQCINWLRRLQLRSGGEEFFNDIELLYGSRLRQATKPLRSIAKYMKNKRNIEG